MTSPAQYIRDWMDETGTSALELAGAANISVQRVYQFRSGGHPVPPHVALLLETATEGNLDASMLSETIFRARVQSPDRPHAWKDV